MTALDDYVEGARNMGINLAIGFLFRPIDISKSGVLEESLSYSVAYDRLKHYLKILDIDEGEPHSLRRGCAISLSLSGSASQAQIMNHIGWFSESSLRRYNELPNILETDIVSNLALSTAGNVYSSLNSTKVLPKAF